MRCMACLEMAKVLDALRASQGERLQVDFIDVFEDPEAGDRYGLKMIPTQILYDAAGRRSSATSATSPTTTSSRSSASWA